MLCPEVTALLEKWDVAPEFVKRFEDERIKLSTLKLLNAQSLERLFAEVGPRFEFQANLSEYLQTATLHSKQAPVILTEANGETGEVVENINAIETMGAEVATQGLADIPTPKATGKKRSHDDDYDLLQILKSNVKGMVAIGFHSSHNQLDESHRNKIGDVIIAHHLQNDVNRTLSDYDMLSIFTEIKKLFPQEREEIWLGGKGHKRETSLGRGKLLNRFYNMRRQLSNCGMRHKKAQTAVPTVDENENYTADEEVEDGIQWLKNNKHPWSRVMELWETTSKGRMHLLHASKCEVHDYIKMFPALRDQSGYLLFEVDYEKMYPSSSMRLYMEWPMLASFIGNKIPNCSKQEIEDSLTPDAKRTRTLLSLNKLLPVVTAIKKGRNQWRPSRQESRGGPILLVQNNADIQTDLRIRSEKYEKYGLKLGPQAFMVGSDEYNITECYTVINQILYEVETPIKALDITFKAMHALDTPYHKESLREWLFLQIAIYGINTKFDKKCLDAKTLALINEYKDFKAGQPHVE